MNKPASEPKEHEEGLEMEIGRSGGLVFINFNQRCSGFTMTPLEARAFAVQLKKQANKR